MISKRVAERYAQKELKQLRVLASSNCPPLTINESEPSGLHSMLLIGGPLVLLGIVVVGLLIKM